MPDDRIRNRTLRRPLPVIQRDVDGLGEVEIEASLNKAGYHNVYENVYERQAIYDKVFMSNIMRGYKVCVRGAGCFYPYIQETPFKPDSFNISRNILKVYVCWEPEKILCKEIPVTEKDLKRYEEVKVGEGELFG